MPEAEFVLAAALTVLAYTFVGYPALIWAWSRLRPRPVQRGGAPPSVSVVLAACDEEACIEKRLENLLSQDYPPERLEILVASDGSRDATLERARAFESRGVRVFDLTPRRGKPAALNVLARAARGDILVFTDARQRFERHTLGALVAPFADKGVGGVSGELILVADPDRGPVAAGVGFYWRYEKLIRRAESRVHSTVGATGAVYAIRRELFRSVPTDTLLDDVLIPLRVVAQGKRVVFESAARAYDHAPPTAAHELTRKARTLAGNFQMFARERWLLDPLRNPIVFQTLSHKALRLLTPVALVLALAANLRLAGTAPYGILLAAQLAFYAAAGAGHTLRKRGHRTFLLALPYVICLLSWATVVGFVRFVRGGQSVTWEKAASA
jgi:poly-beta-1,6-N-acetyl-D-glucosamine synthase